MQIGKRQSNGEREAWSVRRGGGPPPSPRTEATGRRLSVGWLRSSALLLFLLAWAVVLPAFGQTNAPQSAASENRYLLVVESSRSMLRRAPATLNILGGLLNSGFNGQLHAGDSIGVWTFGEDLYTGRFPLQHWTPKSRTDVAERVVTFLNEQKYEKEANYDKLLAALSRLVKDSPFITIVLVTDGEDKIVGTPFDSRINDTFQAWRERQQAAQMPFVTVLRAKGGVLTDCTVSPAPWAVEMPPLPAELLAPPAAQTAAAKPAAPVVPPLIIHGKKPEPVESAAPASVPPATNSAAAGLAATNFALAQSPAAVASATNTLSATQPSAALSANVAASSSSVAFAPGPKAGALPAPVAPGRKGLWVAVVAVAVALLGLALVLFLRARPAAGPSLITQSLERQSK